MINFLYYSVMGALLVVAMYLSFTWQQELRKMAVKEAIIELQKDQPRK